MVCAPHRPHRHLALRGPLAPASPGALASSLALRGSGTFLAQSLYAWSSLSPDMLSVSLLELLEHGARNETDCLPLVEARARNRGVGRAVLSLTPPGEDPFRPLLDSGDCQQSWGFFAMVTFPLRSSVPASQCPLSASIPVTLGYDGSICTVPWSP